eukprot:CAMPEP_0118933574 /NCGR_PEP_ID=MMETSP1169-20130426/12068_1 /TAXON_ID=36882 /ORGANISM="Pyramimonas obovata, Strain CCMP722" /LENGTH=415 /DNA_ID=CAMNT_0006876357 /DNA_START=95 /DNA_END=1342 /DNA_ORIENTATION=-
MTTYGLAPMLGSLNSRPLSSSVECSVSRADSTRVVRCVRRLNSRSAHIHTPRLCVQMRNDRDELREGLHKPEGLRAASCATTSMLTKDESKKSVVPGKAQFTDANFPTDSEGRVYHLGVKRGEVANRILSVGDTGRARMLSGLLEPAVAGGEVFETTSARGFTVFTGRKLGVPISIISTGMGTPMMDFVVRESRAIVDGHMAIARLGTCGILREDVSVGSVMVASKGSVFIRRDPDAFASPEDSPEPVNDSDCAGPTVLPLPYRISKVVQADAELSQVLGSEMRAQCEPIGSAVIEGLNATADSFYSSQARLGGDFDDRNDALLANLLEQYPAAASLEMETFHLLDLARCSRGTISASACAIGLAQRKSNAFIEAARIKVLEKKAGEAVLRALVLHKFEDDQKGGCVDKELRVWS